MPANMPEAYDEMPLEDFDPERDLKPVADFVDQFLMGEGEEPVPVPVPEDTELAQVETGESLEDVIRELTDEMDDNEKKDIRAANKAAVEDNLPLFIERLNEVGPPSQWSSAVAATIGKEMKNALTRAWGYLDREEKKDILSTGLAGMNTETDEDKPADYDDFDTMKEQMLTEPLPE